MPQIRERVGGEWGKREVGRVEGEGGRLMMLSNTCDQVVCTVGQTDGHSSPYHTTSHAGMQWDRIGPQAILLMPLKGITVSIMVLHDLTGLKTDRL